MRRLIAAWEGFWFGPTPVSTLALVRIAFGVVMVGWTVSLVPDLFTFFSSGGLSPQVPFKRRPAEPATWSLLELSSSRVAVVILFLLLLAGSVCLLIGYRSRLASVIVFLGLVSFERRNPVVFNSGDGLLRSISLFLTFAPTGAALSLDRWKNMRERFWEFPARAPWALRLVQVNLSVVYLSAVWAKVQGATWNDGTALWYVFRLADHERFATPGLGSGSLLLVNLLTYGTLAIELALAILLWHRRALPWVLPIGVVWHLAIDYSLYVGFFSFAVFVSYLAFLPPDRTRDWILGVRVWFLRLSPGSQSASPVEGSHEDRAREAATAAAAGGSRSGWPSGNPQERGG